MAVDGQRILTPEQFVKQIKGALDQQKNNITVTFKVEDESPKKKYDPSDAIYEVTFVHDEMMGITLSNLTGFPLPVREEGAATATATTTTDSLAPASHRSSRMSTRTSPRPSRGTSSSASTTTSSTTTTPRLRAPSVSSRCSRDP